MAARPSRAVAIHLRQVLQLHTGRRPGPPGFLGTKASRHRFVTQQEAWRSTSTHKKNTLSNSSPLTPSRATHSDTVRKLMRHVPHPVAIITAAPPPSAPSTSSPATHPSAHWRGATISSFVTVALDPAPIVCFNIKHDSSTLAALTSSRHFNVHILRPSPDAEAIALKFAGGNALEPFHDGEGELEWWVRGPDDREVEGGAPVIQGRVNEVEVEEGAARDVVVSFRLACEHLAEKTVTVGDHVVVFGRVVDVDHGLDEREPGTKGAAPCLLYVDGGFSRIADK